MKKEKLSLKGIKNVLSRNEMKRIMAGSGGGCRSFLNGCYNPNNVSCCPGVECIGGWPDQGIGYCAA